MSSFSTTKKHPVDGDMRQCLAIDDFFGGHEYGYWFARQGVTESITFSTSHEKMEDIIYSEDEVQTAPVPEEYKKKKKMTHQELKQKAKELGEQPAFPNGLTKREYFAGVAIQNVINPDAKFIYSPRQAAKIAVEQTDALLEELVRET